VESTPEKPVLPPGLAACAIGLAAAGAYANSLSTPFLFLDQSAIVDNPTIRHLWPPGRVLLPPSAGGLAVGGRPVVNLSLAVNYALGGTHPWGYHAFNLAVHIAASLALLGILRRVFRALPRFAPSGGALAFLVALIWALHPLQTESVTYVIQRAESLMGMFYLLTLYCFIRYAEAGGGQARPEAGMRVWGFLSFLACLLGMATKEVMVSAPVIVLLYDRSFVSGTFREAWRRHGRLFLGLAATWIVLAALVAGTGGSRGGTSGFGLKVSWWDYALTQAPAIVRYLGLALWPRHLDFHYGVQWVRSPLSVLPEAVIVGVLLAATVRGLLRSSGPGFAGVFFFAILAPTSLVPGMTQTMAEHRMYLALAPVAAVLACGAFASAGALGGRRGRVAAAGALLCVGAALGTLTALRNRVYRSELSLWADTVLRSPWNPYAFNNLGIALSGAGRSGEAIAALTRALELSPGYAEAHNNLGLALVDAGRSGEAIAHYEEALRLRAEYPEAEANLGVALAQAGRQAEAIGHFERAVRLDPASATALNDLAVALAGAGRLPEAIARYREVLRLKPGYSETHYNLGNALLGTGDLAGAIAQYEAALRLNPDYPEAEANLGAALADSGRPAEAIGHYERALRLSPGDADVRHNLGLAIRAAGGAR
jgi:tetratricopeptide (TPR) repeat protein